MRNTNRQRVLSITAHMACALALFTLALFSLNLPAKATINVTPSTDATALANAIIGSNSSVVLIGTPVLSVGSSTDSSGTFTTTGSNLGLDRGIVLSTGGIDDFADESGSGSDITGGINMKRDIVTLSFSFTPKAGVTALSFRSVFTSREYACRFDVFDSDFFLHYNDGFTIALSGAGYDNVNIATIPGTTSAVSFATLNWKANASYFRDNTVTPKPLPEVVFAGASTVLTHGFTVVPGTPYYVTIEIFDWFDIHCNSEVFIGVMAQYTGRIQLDLSAAQQGTGYTTVWTKVGPAVPIAGADVAIRGENIPNGIASLSSATITLDNPAQGDLLSVTGTLPAGIGVSAYDPATGAITLSGMATYAAYQTALAQIRYSGTATTTGPARTTKVIVYYTTLASNTAIATINIADPRIELDLATNQQGTGYTTVWTKVGPAVPIAGADVVIRGEDIPGGIASLSSATITLDNPAQGDLLSVTGTLPAGIGASAYNPATGVITLSGTATYAAYQTALRQVVYSGTATTPGLARTAKVIVYYTTLASNTATVTIHIAALDISKTYVLPHDGAARLGDVITYTYRVTNSGSIPIRNVRVRDLHGSPPVQVPLGAGGITNESLTNPGRGRVKAPDSTPNDGIWDILDSQAIVTFTWQHIVTQEEVTHG